MVVCKYFLQGKCYKGSDCNFSHVIDSRDSQGYRGNNYGSNVNNRNNYNQNFNKNQNYNQNRNYNQNQTNQNRNYNQNFNQNRNYNQNYNQTNQNYNKQNYHNQNFDNNQRYGSNQNARFQSKDQFRNDQRPQEQQVQFSFTKKLQETQLSGHQNINQIPSASGFSFTNTFNSMQESKNLSNISHVSNQMQSSFSTIQNNPPKVVDIYSKLDELNENDKCSFMANKFESNKIPLIPPPKECC